MNLGGTIQTMTDSQDRKYRIRQAVLKGAYANEGLWSLNFINLAACLPAVQETRFDPLVRKILWRRKWQSTPVSLPGKSHGQRSLVGCSPWACRVGHDWVANTLTFMFTSACVQLSKLNETSLTFDFLKCKMELTLYVNHGIVERIKWQLINSPH